MAYNAVLVKRIEKLLRRRRSVTQKKMFGGACFLVNGKMCCGVIGNRLVARVGPERYDSTLARPYAKPMDFTGRPLRGFVYVLPQGLRTRAALKAWVDLALGYAASLPTKRR